MKNQWLAVVLCAGALLVSSFGVVTSAPATFAVNDTTDLVDDNPGNGFCHTAVNTCTLRAAITEANYTNGATVSVPAGTYFLTIPNTGDFDDRGALKIRKDTAISGAGAAVTIVDGNGAVINDRVFDIYTPVTQTASIAGLTIRNGKMTGYYGGGIHILGPLSLSDCIVTHNHADFGAGGIWLDGLGGSPVFTMTNCVVSSNTSADRAGGVDNDGGTLIINNSTIISNTSVRLGGGLYANGNSGQTIVNGGIIVGNSSQADGGGVYVVPYSPAQLNGVVIDANTAITNGGGIFSGGYLTLTNNTRVQNNSAYNGGGVYVDNTIFSALLSNSSILSNTASNHGGGIFDRGIVSLQLSGMTVNANQATRSGGGLYIYDTVTPLRVNTSGFDSNVSGESGGGVYMRSGVGIFNASTLNGNYTDSQFASGGGIYNGGTLTLTNSTLSGNFGVGYGGGIYNAIAAGASLFNVTVAYNVSGAEFEGFPGNGSLGGGIANSGGTVSLRNTIVATNTYETGTFDLVANDCDGTFISQAYNLVETTSGCNLTVDTTGNITGAEPLLGPLAFNGGGTKTHAPLPGSPAIDHGNPAGCKDGSNVTLTVDQRGRRRPYPGGGRCDIGAYELGWWLYLPVVLR